VVKSKILLGLETNPFGVHALVTILERYKDDNVSPKNEERVVGWLLSKLRLLNGVLMRDGYNHHLLELYQLKGFVFKNYFNRTIKVDEVKEGDLRAIVVWDSQFSDAELVNNSGLLISLDSEEVSVLRSAFMYCSGLDDYKKLRGGIHYLYDQMFKLDEVYVKANQVQLYQRLLANDIEDTALDDLRGVDGCLRFEGFKFIGIYKR